jgi:hypothetical protein
MIQEPKELKERRAHFKMAESQIDAVQSWRRCQADDVPSFSEALRRLIDRGLAGRNQPQNPER